MNIVEAVLAQECKAIETENGEQQHQRVYASRKEVSHFFFAIPQVRF